MFLFLISFVLVFLSSYLFSVVFAKKFYEFFVYIFGIAFAQLVLTFEILSLFKSMNNVLLVLLFNVIFFAVAFCLWFKKGKPYIKTEFKRFFSQIFNACKLDKILAVAVIGFIFLLITAFVLNIICPIASADAEDYHVSRSMWYLIHGSLNHFPVADIRAIVFPFNSEILYAWIILFIKKEAFFGFFSLIGFVIAIASIWKMMKLLGFSTRKILWSICVVSSFSSVLIQISGTETDVLLGGLLLTSFVLFWISLKDNNKFALFFSSLYYALAIGTKTPALIAVPAIGFLMLVLCFKYKSFKNLLYFCLITCLNFGIFASYNYILNFIDFGNPMGSNSLMAAHKNFYGIKGMFASFVRHLFLFFDFTGFKWSMFFGPYILKFKILVLNFLSLASVPEGIYSNPMQKHSVNGSIIEPHVSVGLVGMLLCLPTCLFALIKSIFSKNYRERFCALLVVTFCLYLLCLSYLICYMNFNTRFLTTFLLFITPVYSYAYFRRNRFVKSFFVLLMSYYLFLVSSHLWPRPLVHMVKKMIIEKESIRDIRTRISCSNFLVKKGFNFNQESAFWKVFNKTFDLKNKKILYFVSSSTQLTTPAMLTLKGFTNVELGLIYNYKKTNLKDYDYLVFYKLAQYSTAFKDENINLNYTKSGKTIKIKEKSDFYCFYITSEEDSVLKSKDYYAKDMSKYPFSMECFFDESTLKKEGFILVEDTFNHRVYKNTLNN